MARKARFLGVNHVAVEVGNIEEALKFYGSLVELELRGRGPGMAFIDAGDQFIALSEGRTQPPDRHRHLGLVVDNKEAVRRALKELGVEVLPGRGLASGTRGATAGRSSSTRTSSSLRPPTRCMAWAWSGCARTSGPCASWTPRA